MSTDCHIKTCRPLKRRAILKIVPREIELQYRFIEEPMLFLLALK